MTLSSGEQPATAYSNPTAPPLPVVGVGSRTLKLLDELCDAKSVLNHPFYLAWQQGKLPREALSDYATHYYHYIAAFPTHISALHSRSQDMYTRRLLFQNLMEEEMGADNHPELWLRFAEGMGVPRETVFATPASPQSQFLTDTFWRLTRARSFVTGLAALYAYERQMPAISNAKINGLVRFYGVKDSVEDRNTLAYFRVHAEADIRHAEDARQLLKMHLKTEDDVVSAINGAVELADALWELLTEIGLRYNFAPPGGQRSKTGSRS